MVTSRASVVLDSLMGRESISGDTPGGSAPLRRTLFRRDPIGAKSRPGLDLLRRRWPLVIAAAVLAVGLAVGIGYGWTNLRRPVPIEDRMPLTDGDTAGGGTGGSGGSTGSNLAAGQGTPTGSKVGSSTGEASAAESSLSGAPDGGSSSGEIVVHVAGAVVAPGVVTLAANSRVVDAVTAAGGLRPDADPERVNLAEPLSDGVRIVVPAIGQESVPQAVAVTPPTGIQEGASGSGSTGRSGSAGGSSTALVNLNTASADELEQLPGIGPATAAAIIANREKDGPFKSVEALLDVRGIGEAKLDAIRDLVTVG